MSEKCARSPLLHPVVIAAVFTLLGAALSGIIEGYWQNRLDAQKFEAALIHQALQPESPEAAAANLLFLVNSGLVVDREGKIRKLAESPDDLPTKWGSSWGLPWR